MDAIETDMDNRVPEFGDWGQYIIKQNISVTPHEVQMMAYLFSNGISYENSIWRVISKNYEGLGEILNNERFIKLMNLINNEGV